MNRALPKVPGVTPVFVVSNQNFPAVILPIAERLTFGATSVDPCTILVVQSVAGADPDEAVDSVTPVSDAFPDPAIRL